MADVGEIPEDVPPNADNLQDSHLDGLPPPHHVDAEDVPVMVADAPATEVAEHLERPSKQLGRKPPSRDSAAVKPPSRDSAPAKPPSRDQAPPSRDSAHKSSTPVLPAIDKKSPTPPASPPPPLPAAQPEQKSSGLASKLNSLKERRQSTTPPSQALPPVKTPPKVASPGASKLLTGAAAAAGAPEGSGYGASPMRGGKIPSASPQRGRKLSPGPRRPSPRGGLKSARSVGGYSSGGDASPGRSLSPSKEGGWNIYGRDPARQRAPIALSGPSEEERAKRKLWAAEKRRKEEARSRIEAERRAAELERRRQEEEARLEARRASIRERILKQQEIQAKLAAERAAAEERAKADLQRFKPAKPLHERLMEEYERQRAEEEMMKKRQYDEEVARMRHVRPHQIITGEVVIRPPPSHSPPRERELPNFVAGPVHSGFAGVPGYGPGGLVLIGGNSPHNSPKRDGRASQGGGIVGAGGQQGEGGYGSDAAGGGALGSGPYPPGAGAPHAPLHPVRGHHRERQQREDKPRLQGMVLYSTRAKGESVGGRGSLGPLPQLMERGVSPFVFNAESVPVNVPDQTQFWPSAGSKGGKPEVLEVEGGGEVDGEVEYEADPLGLSTAQELEDGDAPQQASPTGSAAAAAAAIKGGPRASGTGSKRPSSTGAGRGSQRGSLSGAGAVGGGQVSQAPGEEPLVEGEEGEEGAAGYEGEGFEPESPGAVQAVEEDSPADPPAQEEEGGAEEEQEQEAGAAVGAGEEGQEAAGEEDAELQAQRDRAAKNIQAASKGYLARKQIAQMKAEQAAAEAAAAGGDAAGDEGAAPAEAGEAADADADAQAEKDRAARNIQAASKGYLARKQIAQMKAEQAAAAAAEAAAEQGGEEQGEEAPVEDQPAEEAAGEEQEQEQGELEAPEQPQEGEEQQAEGEGGQEEVECAGEGEAAAAGAEVAPPVEGQEGAQAADEPPEQPTNY